jgi:hypothetical protein
MFDCKQILQWRFAGQYKNHLALIGGSILPVFRADAEGKREYGMLKKPKPFASNKKYSANLKTSFERKIYVFS